MKLLLLALFTTSQIIFQTLANEKPMLDNKLFIEHAEVILPDDNTNEAKAFLIIWNGTRQSARIVSIKKQNGIVRLIRNTKGLDGTILTSELSIPRTIPARSELMMRDDGIYLYVSANDSKGNSDSYSFSVEFEDGTVITSEATILTPGSKPTDHHHALYDR